MRHLMGVKGDVGACQKVPLEIKEASEKNKVVNDVAVGQEKDDDEVEALEEIYNIRVGKRLAATGSTPAAKGNTVKDHMDLHMPIEENRIASLIQLLPYTVVALPLKQTIAESVGDWYFDREAVKRIDCSSFSCNPTCHNMDFT
ncbi:Pectin acetylesterase 5 [Glycine soja]